MKKVIDIGSNHSIEYDNSRILSKGNYANIYYAKLIEHKNNGSSMYSKHLIPLKKSRNFFKLFICAARNSSQSLDDDIISDDIIIKIADSNSRDIENEIKMLLELNDEPNIIHIKKAIEGCIYKHYRFIGLECCKGGDLFNYLDKRNKVFTEQEVRVILKQLINAINACHKHGIVHGDIKLENIGLVRNNDITEIKLLDFGGSYKIQHLDDESEHTASEFSITASPHYISPELASDEILIKERELIYTDFWELGILCYILLTGIYPFGGIRSRLSDIKHHVLYDEVKWPKKKQISNEMKKYIEDLLKKKPQDRHVYNLYEL